jgi:DNA polymerase-3 subunit alpha
MGNTDKLMLFRREAQRIGVKVIPPSVNVSGVDFAVVDGAVLYSLAALKNVGAGAIDHIVKVREEGGPFKSLGDFAKRIDARMVNKRALESLAKAGAFDTMEGNRARLVAGAELILRRAQASAEDRSSSQIALFGGSDAPAEALRLPEVPDWPQLDRLGFEAEAVGFHLSAHPLDTYKPLLARLGVTPIGQVGARAKAGTGRVKLAGTVVNSKERPTRTGSRMAWVTLSDASGSIEVTLFSEVLARGRTLLEEGNLILLTVELRTEGETLRLTAQEMEGLEQAARQVGQGVRLWLDGPAAVDPIRVLLDREGRGRGRVSVVARLGEGQEVEMALPGGFNVSPRMMQAMKVLPGVAEVEAV